MSRRKSWLEKARWLLLLSGLLLLNGCGKAVGRLSFAGEGTRSAAVSLAAGDVAFWTELALEYEKPAALSYHIELEQGGASVASVECDPLGRLDIKVGWAEAGVGNLRSVRGSGRMLCSAQIAKAGLTTVRASLAFSSRPTTLNFGKADLVLKQ
jgi:hypothetical protein